ncbi:MAG: hypothetical protein B7Y12_20475 [Rhizobiales bacterium 24-66-13]|jgi:hypothetical protein|nr:MAG: hypothetical protein B7Z41_06900 [Rhizobiales bacterium 12-66-7]OYY82173.1 MAG: hypothetical protein B7Y61_12275 [Rhizobiales bacterium 35-66-30]OYZ68459.1 MAG: hypothetical protein B7Y12_20475 [Rhizobiales bacterium 24-66-13]OZB05314.1 MAG: hypothetical protein B7X67_12325 [Rhizobiales bacterium 39-66-18]HQS10044.1 DUF2865 domain-containing protein [Xanthobacteraceae bacterium]
MRTAWKLQAAAVLLVAFGAGPAAAQSPGDFFAALFGGIIRAVPIAPPTITVTPSTEPRRSTGGGVAFCVRTCDGRYFPLSGVSSGQEEGRCAALCPAATTTVFRGGSIEHATDRAGASYADMPNAFLYRTKLTDACTCTGNGPLGLAAVPIEEDASLQKGDIVMQVDGPRIFAGAKGGVPYSPAAFVPPERYPRISSDLKRRIQDLMVSRGATGNFIR